VSITANIDRITRVPDAYRMPVVPAPKSVKIELSPRCNLRCAFCSLRTRETQPGVEDDMDFSLFRRITTEMREAGVEEIGAFYLGESFSNPELLVKAVRWCKHDLQFPYVFLTTNGTLASPDVVEEVMRAGLDSLKWSVNAADEAQYAAIMGVKGSLFWRSLANLRDAWRIRQAGELPTRLYASSIRYNDEQDRCMDIMLKHFVLPYVDEHYWLPAYSMALRAEEMRERHGWNVTVGNMGRYDPALGTGNRAGQDVCWAAFTEGHVRADGHLSACCFGSTDRFDVGDLTRESFLDAWNGAAMQHIRGLHLRVSEEGPEVLRGSMCEVCLPEKADAVQGQEG